MNAKLTPRTCLLMIAAVSALGASPAVAKDQPAPECTAARHQLFETSENLFNCGFRDERGTMMGAEGPIRTLEGGTMKVETMAPSRPWVNDYIRNTHEQNALGGGE